MTRTVVVVPYDERWAEAYGLARDRLTTVLGPAASAIHHVGSTSVPGLCAKPVIDILVEATDLALIDQAAPELEARGFEARGEYGIPGRRYFSRPPGPGLKVHVHVFRQADERIAHHLRFRDYLCTHPSAARRYCALKRRLAAVHSLDRDAYQAGKSDFIRSIQTKASAWAASVDSG